MTVNAVSDADELRRRLAAARGPLVDPGPPGYVTATFVWRQPPDSTVRHVYLDANGITDRNRPDLGAFTRVPDSDLWALSITLPEGWRGGYGFLPRVDPITGPTSGETEWQWWRRVLSGLVTDDTNRLPPIATMGLPARSEAVMPAAPPQRWWGSARPDSLGATTVVTFPLLGVPRRIWIYEPVGLPDTNRPLALLFDGQVTALATPLGPSFDLLAERGCRVPLVVMIESLDPAQREVELTCNPGFLAEITDELLPLLRSEWQVTADPRSVLVAGASYGGLAATHAALHAPDHVGGAVSLSGSFWWPRPRAGEDRTGARSIQQQIPAAAPGTARFWMSAGELEPRLIEENRQVRDRLRSHGFAVDYREFCGGHDWVQWRDALVEGIATLLGAES